MGLKALFHIQQKKTICAARLTSVFRIVRGDHVLPRHLIVPEPSLAAHSLDSGFPIKRMPAGVLLADSRAQAEAAIFAVKVEYADVAAKLVVDTEIPLSWEKGETPRTMRTGPATRAGHDSTDGECKALSDLQRCFIVKQNITFELQRKHEDNLFYLHDDYFF
jgi:hypothetical protein